MVDKLDNILNVHAEALRLRAQRQQVIASNMANADTPNYKAVDFKFADALRAATGMGSAQLPATQLVRSAPGHLAPQGSKGGMPVQMLYRTPIQASVDGNTVNADGERARFADNAVRYEASLRFLNQQLKTMLSAVQNQ
jgi:flagellar basal-body rod protein FlgB